jgi:hypothetical protein
MEKNNPNRANPGALWASAQTAKGEKAIGSNLESD